MDNFMKSILSRVLSQEIGNQKKWEQDDIERFGKSICNREDNIRRITEFMKENGIEIRPDFM